MTPQACLSARTRPDLIGDWVPGGLGPRVPENRAINGMRRLILGGAKIEPDFGNRLSDHFDLFQVTRPKAGFFGQL